MNTTARPVTAQSVQASRYAIARYTPAPSALAIALALLAGCTTNPGQQTNPSTVPAQTQSITDKQIHADYQGYEAQQNAIKALNDSGSHRVASYSMAKAQCWLDVSFHEYTRNDRSNFPRLSFGESKKITDYLASKASATAAANPALQTPLVNESARLRADLWDAIGKLKGDAGFACAEQKTACAEVELVHAGNEFNQQQWRHAKPYVQMAEDLIADAQKAAQACTPPTPKTVAAVVAPVVAPAIAPATAVFLSANVLFNFDKRDITNVRSYTKDQLDGLVAQIKGATITVQNIKVVGHADRLNSTGDAQFNVKLSQDRMATIRAYLEAAGIAASAITSEYKADSQPVQTCDKDKFRSAVELQECLLPNRRVEVIVVGVQKQK